MKQTVLMIDDDSIPIVVFTTTDTAEEREECIRLGANTFITKPSELKHWEFFVQALCYLYLKHCLSHQD